MSNLSKLEEILKKDNDFLRLKELEKLIDSNEDILKLIKNKQEVSKEIVLSKKLGLKENVKYYMDQYDLIDQQLLEFEHMDEYMTLLNKYHDLYEDIIKYLERKINKGLI